MFITTGEETTKRKIMTRGLRYLPLLLISGVLLVTACSKEKSFENGKDPGDLRIREYPLGIVGDSGTVGTITIAENADSSFNIMVTMNSSVKDTVHILHLHNGSMENPGTIAYDLTSVKGTGGVVQSVTSNITEIMFPDNTPRKVNWDDIISFTGYVDVHYSALQPNVLIAQGKIGN
jgi:hypothetical protein